ncbi:UNVERIFIED_CONTAM: hypothetical protein Slati_3041900 [Sesamum latifolium]|uniref:Uncharacterized protein n=1 Tax=Sesamum latifolium TaxID=2727402 RepID=A0AAW2VJW2_9LAMI
MGAVQQMIALTIREQLMVVTRMPVEASVEAKAIAKREVPETRRPMAPQGSKVNPHNFQKEFHSNR